MKKLFAIAVLVLVMILVLQAVSLACIPPDDPADCSAGYWKNHTEDWESGPFIEGWTFETMLAALKSKGNDPLRADAVEFLNWEYPDAPCDDD